MRKEDFLRDLKSTNITELGMDDWFNIYLKQGFYRASGEQKSDIRALESKKWQIKVFGNAEVTIEFMSGKEGQGERGKQTPTEGSRMLNGMARSSTV
jgi:hypothetical protein